MPDLKDILRRRNLIHNRTLLQQPPLPSTNTSTTIPPPPIPPVTIRRVNTQGGDEPLDPSDESPAHRSRLPFRPETPDLSLDGSASTIHLASPGHEPKRERRLSGMLQHIRQSHSRSRSREKNSPAPSHIPGNLGVAPEPIFTTSRAAAEDEALLEALWERRATSLARSNPLVGGYAHMASANPESSPPNADMPTLEDATALHMAGDYTRSTSMLAQLASPAGANDALAQVLYGMALRHGWGTPVDAERAVGYFSLAATTAGGIEDAALAQGRLHGGPAKGELVLAMFELGNCFRHGWGVEKDAAAAWVYYEIAANLGDADALEEAAWCLLEGFGVGKDKFKAAQYLRLAEHKRGQPAVGNSWIWKDKYNPPPSWSSSKSPAG